MSRRTAYAHLERNLDFAEEWDDALNQSVDALEHEAYQRAIQGAPQLTMFLLKGPPTAGSSRANRSCGCWQHNHSAPEGIGERMTTKSDFILVPLSDVMFK